MRTPALLASLALLGAVSARAQETFTHADTLRGSNGPARAWWDARFYDLHVRVDPADSSVRGWNAITYTVLAAAREMQIDLQVPLEADSFVQDGRRLASRRDGDAFFVTLREPQRAGEVRTLTVWYHGRPRVATNPPWDGGFTWTTDSLGNRWVATTDEGLGASVYWPLKDWLGDEPDSQRIAITVPDPMLDVSNGRLRSVTHNPDGTTTFEWFVADPINSYDVAVNAGTYAHYGDTLAGEAGKLSLDFWPLAYHVEAAQRQWRQVRAMLQCFEHWFGPYPWYADGYKLVEAPHLGMEHQSAIAYGNRFMNGYLGRDLSRTGLGLTWDYIIVHESAHEWWGNNLTMQDQADMWIHEGFAYYAEGLFTECQQGRMAGAAYLIGSRRGIRNDRPVVAAYGVNAEGSGDMYPKGANMLHTIRQIVGDDAKWRAILRGLNATFWHQTVTGRQVEDYISRQAGVDLGRVFEQYLTTTLIPELQFKVEAGTLSYRWARVVPGFDMQVKVNVPGLGDLVLHPTEAWQTMPVTSPDASQLVVDENYYVTARDVGGPGGGR